MKKTKFPPTKIKNSNQNLNPSEAGTSFSLLKLHLASLKKRPALMLIRPMQSNLPDFQGQTFFLVQKSVSQGR